MHNVENLKKKSICLANSARVETFDKYDDDGNPVYKYVTKKCGWLNNGCKELACSDLIGAYYNNDTNCAAELSTCISNRVDACITKYDCSKLTGTQTTCLNYPGYCTNITGATDTSPCIQKKCSDNTDATVNSTCATFLPGCISNGRGCVDYNTPCSSMKGTQETCNKLYAYKKGTSTDFEVNQCYNTSTATENDYCQVKTCKLAKDQTDGTCGSFLEGCFYNGNGGCVDPKAIDTTCGSYTGNTSFCENAIVQDNSTKYCFGTTTSAACTERKCADNPTATKDEDCEIHLTGCFAKSDGGYTSKSTRTCAQQSGTVTSCSNFSGGLYVNSEWTKVGYVQIKQLLHKLLIVLITNQLVDFQNLDLHALMQELVILIAFLIHQQVRLLYRHQRQHWIAMWLHKRSFQVFNQNLRLILECIHYFIMQDKCQLAETICYLPKSDCIYDYGSTDSNDTLKLTQCQKYQNTKGQSCTFKSTEVKCSLQDSCEKLIVQTSAQACNDSAVFTSSGKCQKVTDSNCITVNTDCAKYSFSTTVTDATKKKELCWGLKIIDNLANLATGCYYYSGKCYAAVASGACPTSFPSGVDTDTKKSLYCKSIKEATTLYCQYDQAGNKCVVGANADCAISSFPASLWDGKATTASDFKSTFSLAQTYNTRTKNCKLKSDSSACEEATCADIPSPTSQGDCDNYISGCVYYKNKCYVGAMTAGADCANSAKASIDSALSATEKVAQCQLFHTSDKTIYCTYDQYNSGGAPATCIVGDTCASYTALPTSNTDKQTYCSSKINKTGQKCAFTTDAVKCRDFDCYNIQNPTSQIDCDEGAQTKKCVYLLGTCYNKEAISYCDQVSAATSCTYISGTSCAIEQDCHLNSVTSNQATVCATLTNSSGAKCTYIGGNGCALLGACDAYDGTTSGEETQGPEADKEVEQCKAVKSDTNYPCIKKAAKQCKEQLCTDNDASATDCVNNADSCLYYSNKCIDKKLCGDYTPVGDNNTAKQAWCEGVQNISGNLCAWNSTTSLCKDRTCDDKSFQTDFDCKSYLKTCKTDGYKCVAMTTECTASNGSQNFCEYLLDKTGNDKCRAITTATTTSSACVNRRCNDNVTAESDPECAKKKCGDISAKNNDECESGMPKFKKEDNPFCVFDGTACIDQGKSCNSFNGTEETCPTFLAKDGPCKATTVGTIKGACAKRICTEASNTLTTDADCQKYHKDCYTTGHGCSSVKRCSNLTSQASCKLRAECTWANQCTNAITACSTYNYTNYSQCTNSKVNGKFCAWQESNSTCRAQICEDQPATITTHKQCNHFAETYTTSGVGCITISLCQNYKTQSICIAASTDKGGVGRCGWDTLTNKCRARICSDKNGLTDDECNTFLTGCKTNGAGCVAGLYCTEFTNKQFCIKAKNGPCLWVNGQCYDYDRCEDAVKKTHPECQAFSPLCTTNGDTSCVPITSCTSTAIKASCVVGTDGACGWLPTGKYQKFGQCTDAVAATNDECVSYGPTCMTDGTTCIAKTTCSFYKTQTACNNNGTDGICYWNSTNTTCKLKECSDEQKGTNDQCKLISVTGGSCTTDGTKCIPISTCTSYVEAGCIIGTDFLFAIKSQLRYFIRITCLAFLATFFNQQ